MLVIHSRIAPQAAADAELELTFEARSKSRLRCFTTAGEEVGLFLERGQPALADGEFLLARTDASYACAPRPSRCCMSPAPAPSS